ncbi:MAG: hypothetical protein WBP45_04225 [Daejeonella sp.]
MILFHLNNPFINSRISNANFNKMAQTHLARLKANNASKQFDGLINATDPLHEEYKKALVSGSGTSSVKEVQTMSADEGIKGIRAFISRKEGVINDKFSRKSAAYQEFFPLGLSEYTQASKKNIQLITERLIKACENSEVSAINELGTELKALLDAYLDNRETQLKSIGSVKTLSNKGKTQRDQLALQLYINLLSLLLMYASDTDKVKAYYDESFLKKAKIKEIPAGTPPPAV